jgi:hypothetical protein
VRSKEELTKRAISFREYCGLDRRSPVGDIQTLVTKDLGYDLIVEPVNIDFAACVIADKQCQYRIVFNQNQNYGEAFFRFSISHELAHIDLHWDILQNYDGRILHRSKALVGERDDDVEREADQFASVFLAPDDGVNDLIAGEDVSVGLIQKIADHFGISSYAAALKHQDCTQQICDLIVTDCDSGLVQFEKHSSLWHEKYHRPLFRGKPLPQYSVSRYYLDNLSSKTEDEDKLVVWLPNSEDAEKTTFESVFKIEYCNKLFTFLTILD